MASDTPAVGDTITIVTGSTGTVIAVEPAADPADDRITIAVPGRDLQITVTPDQIRV